MSRAITECVIKVSELIRQAKDVFHIIVARLLVSRPLSGTDGPLGENLAIRCSVGEFDTFTVAAEVDGVLAHDVATPNGVDADLLRWAGTDQALAAVYDLFVV